VENPEGISTWLVSAYDVDGESAEAKYPVEALADTAT
jgi:hypothetical protein